MAAEPESEEGFAMRKTLPELRSIAAAIGYQILESEESPDSFYLVRQVEGDAYVVARVELDTPGRTKYNLDELSDALGLAIEKFVATLVGDIRKHYQDVTEVQVDERLTRIADLAEQSSTSEAVSKRTALQLARELHELAKDLCRRHRTRPDNT